MALRSKLVPLYTLSAVFLDQEHAAQGITVLQGGQVMDQIKTGKFIAHMRKKQGLTQKQLAEQLNVTDKTISKWETGYRLPDVSLLPQLSSILKADINELLAGEEFSSKEVSSEEYMKKSENNLLGLMNDLDEMDKKSRSKNLGTLIGFLLTVLAFLYLFASSLKSGRMMDLLDFPTLLFLLGLKFAVLSITGWFHDYLNGWKLLFTRRALPPKDVKLAIQAADYAGTLTLALGCLLALLGLFPMLQYMNSSLSIWRSCAQIALTLLYTAIGKTIYVLLSYKLKRRLL